MKRIFTIALCAVAAAGLLAGCEWSTSSEHNTSWNDSYNWVNFSGTYRSAAGGMLVTDYTSTPSTPGSTNTYTSTESGGTLSSGNTTGGGKVGKHPVVPGSMTIQIGSDITLADDGNGMLSGSGATGTVSYEGGTWSFTLPDTQAQFYNRKITISYAYLVGNSGSASGAKSGSSGKAIYSFVVAQQGEKLTITDNNGATYKGHISNLRSTSGVASTNSMPRDGDVIVASFSTSGTSAAGKQVTITGTFQGNVASSVFTGRTMQGTWIEAGGKTGDINGTTTSVAITPASSTETTSLTISSSTTTSGN